MEGGAAVDNLAGLAIRSVGNGLATGENQFGVVGQQSERGAVAGQRGALGDPLGRIANKANLAAIRKSPRIEDERRAQTLCHVGVENLGLRSAGTGGADRYGHGVAEGDGEIGDFKLRARKPLAPCGAVARDVATVVGDVEIDTRLADVQTGDAYIPVDADPGGAVVGAPIGRCTDVWNGPLTGDPMEGLACGWVDNTTGPDGAGLIAMPVTRGCFLDFSTALGFTV